MQLDIETHFPALLSSQMKRLFGAPPAIETVSRESGGGYNKKCEETAPRRRRDTRLYA